MSMYWKSAFVIKKTGSMLFFGACLVTEKSNMSIENPLSTSLFMVNIPASYIFVYPNVLWLISCWLAAI